MPRDTAFSLTITALSPVHIASGSQITEGYDFVMDKQARTAYIINEDVAFAIAQRKLATRTTNWRKRAAEFENRPARQQSDKDRAALLQEGSGNKDLEKRFERGLTLEDMLDEKRRLLSWREIREGIQEDGQTLVRYTLRGQMSDGNMINEQIKDVFGRAYLPGSSLKGAIRTALGWQLFAERGVVVQIPQLDQRGRPDPGAKHADDDYERELFTADNSREKVDAVNRDVWRGLRVSDSAPLENALILAPLRISKQARPGQPNFDVLNVEAIAKDSQTTATLQLDEYLLGPLPRERGLDYASKGAALRGFVAACRQRGAALIDAELAYFHERNDRPLLQRFYQQLQQEARSLPETSFMLQLGWGTGWHSKTFDDRLSEDAPLFAEIVRTHGLKGNKSRTFTEGDLFPATRKLVLEGEQSAAPLGWVRVDVAEVQR